MLYGSECLGTTKWHVQKISIAEITSIPQWTAFKKRQLQITVAREIKGSINKRKDEGTSLNIAGTTTKTWMHQSL